MTEITAIEKGYTYTLEVKEHASDSRVCAGISALVCTLIGMVKNSSADIVKCKIEPGHVLLVFSTGFDMTIEDFRCVVMGLLMIANKYPDDISMAQNVYDVHEGRM